MTYSPENALNHILFENSPIPMWVFSKKAAKNLAINKECIAKFGHDKAEFSRFSAREIFSNTELLNQVKQLKPGQEGIQFEYQLKQRTKEGKLQCFDASFFAIEWLGEAAILVLLKNAEDVADSVRQVPAHKYKTLFHQSRDIMLLIRVTDDGVYIIDDVNPTFQSVTNIAPSKAIGKTFEEFFSKTTVKNLNDNINQAVKYKRSVQYDHTLELLGKRKTFHIELNPIIDEGGGCYLIAAIARDITEQLIAEKQRRFQSELLDKVGQGVIATDLNGYINFINKATTELLGYEPEDLLNKKIQSIIKLDDTSMQYFKLMQKNLAANNTYSKELIFKAKSGELKIFYVTNSALYDKNGFITGYIGIAADLSAQKEIEKALIDKTNQLKYTLESAEMVSWVYDIKTNLIQREGPFEELLGVDSQMLQGMSSPDYIKKFIFPEDQKLVQKSIAKATKGHAFHQIYRILDGKDKTKWLEDIGKMELDDKGRPRRLGGIMRDITKEKLNQDELEKLSLVASKTENGVVITGPDLVIDWVNHGFTHITGYEAAEVIGKPRRQFLIGPETRHEDLHQIREKIRSKNAFTYEVKSQRKNGEIFWLGLSITPILDKKGNITKIIGIESDITEKKNLDEDRIELIAELTKQNTNLRQFSYIVSHNIRKPVANILGLYNILEIGGIEGLGKDQILELIGTSIRELDQVIIDLNSILDIRDKIEPTREWIDIENELNMVQEDLKNEIKASKANVSIEISGDKMFLSIRSYIHSILYNFLSNSLKYRHPNRTPQIKIAYKMIQDVLILSFQDNGLGIDLEKNRDKLFGLYRRFHPEIEGKGLGLYMIKTQIEAIGGKIEVESKLGEGTTFLVTIRV
jgi:PAS domain S-box-containing protein